MKESKKVYWKGLEQLRNEASFVKNAHDEFAPGPEEDLAHSRRDFLKMMGFGMTAVTLAACEAPIRKAIPYAHKPVDVDPGIANYYASTYINGGDCCSIVVKTREGRPIKIEGNTLSSVTGGGTSAQVEASVLSLYDNSRLRGPKKGKERISWEDLDKEVKAKLDEIAAKGGQIRLVSQTILSPSTKKVIDTFRAAYPTAQHIMYDQHSFCGMLKANEESFGVAMIPSYDFSKANVIVSIAADFLSTWLAPIEFSRQYAATRAVGEDKKTMSRHYQFEGILSLTGANADYRSLVKPSAEGAVAIQLYNIIAARAGQPVLPGGAENIQYLQNAADELWENRGSSLVVAGSNDKAIQTLVNGINTMLGNYGSTILPDVPVNYRQGDDVAMVKFVDELHTGRIDGVIFYNCNPVYDHPMGDQLEAGIKKVALSVSTSYKEDETGVLTMYKAPDHHYLESWNDAEPKRNHFSLTQPAITPVFRSRAAQESFLTWAGQSDADYFEYVKENWRTAFYTGQEGGYQAFWDKCLYDGVYELPTEGAALTFAGDVATAARTIGQNYTATGMELVIYENATVGNGSQANNPLLQELPDPVTKAVWDHYVTVSPKDSNYLETFESKSVYATINANGKALKLPVLVQPGQTPGTIGIALGYGRTRAGKVADNNGTNMYPFLTLLNGSLCYHVVNVKLELTEERFQLAQTQTHQTYMGRQSVIKEYPLETFRNDPEFVKDDFNPQIATWKAPGHKAEPGKINIWKGEHEYKDHHWAMSIDLNTCIGCGSCVVACNVENNVAMVGREEVINRREMHWLRIDRYYSSDAKLDDWTGLEEAAENPEVVFQPMLCQHCNNAPCETVCPVAATTHSTEGLNQMTYNRCIGTRYCANNCPYKVRRFNWFKYHDNRQFENVNPAMNTMLGKMVLNPDVTVRSRGVMEKCSFCVQRIQLGKLTAKKERRKVKDGEIKTACQVACATGAIVFGDINDPESKISKLLKIRPADPEHPYRVEKIADNPRAYTALEEIGVRPNIWYLTKIRNKDAKPA